MVLRSLYCLHNEKKYIQKLLPFERKLVSVGIIRFGTEAHVLNMKNLIMTFEAMIPFSWNQECIS